MKLNRKLKCSEITYEEKMRIEEVCNAIWLSLDTLTQKQYEQRKIHIKKRVLNYISNPEKNGRADRRTLCK
ncbi:MAG: hypothetical protein L6V93_05165 [Clostridiales bacterium]|nr:MAG: hypothetical protein L6V93_05165 [Clostridiales bacterium]